MTRGIDTVGGMAERFGWSYEQALQHVGDHYCLDGRRYIVSCLVSDPSRDHIARAIIRQIKSERKAA